MQSLERVFEVLPMQVHLYRIAVLVDLSIRFWHLRHKASKCIILLLFALFYFCLFVFLHLFRNLSLVGEVPTFFQVLRRGSPRETRDLVCRRVTVRQRVLQLLAVTTLLGAGVLLSHCHGEEVLACCLCLEGVCVGESLIRQKLHVGGHFRQQLRYRLLIVLLDDFVREARYLHALIDV